MATSVPPRRPALKDKPYRATEVSVLERVRNAGQLTVFINGILAGEDRAYWIARLRVAGVPAGAVRTLDEAFNSDEMSARGLLSQVEHSNIGPVPSIASPLRFSGTPVVTPVAAPALGHDNRAVPGTTLGYDAEKIQALFASGAFGNRE